MAPLLKALSPWIGEVMHVMISVLLMTILVSVLGVFDGRPLSHWHGVIPMGDFSINISLNFIVAVLSTIVKVSLAVIVDAGLSQTKWLWFLQQRRSLLDYKRFDDASRGPLGSARLLRVTKFRGFASLGAFIVIIGLTFDPFLQLLVSYEGTLGRVSNANATIARSVYYQFGSRNPCDNYWTDSYNNTFQQPIVGIGEGMNYAIGQTIVNTNSSFDYRPNHSCPTENCTWPAFTSLAVCSQCTDVSFHITTVQVPNTTFQIDNKFTFSSPSIQYSVRTNPGELPLPDVLAGSYVAQFPYPMLENPLGLAGDFENFRARVFATHVTGHPNETFTFQDSDVLLFSLLALHANPSYIEGESSWESAKMAAMECGLYLCTKTYSSVVVNGTLNESIIATESSRTADSYSLVPGWITNTTMGPSRPDSITKLSDPVLRNGSSAALFQPFFVPRTDMSLSAKGGAPGTDTIFNITQTALDAITQHLIFGFSSPIPAQNLTLPLSLPSNFSANAISNNVGDAAIMELLALNSVVARSPDGGKVGHGPILNLFDSWYGSGFLDATEPLSLSPYFDNLAYAITSVMRNAAEPQAFNQGITHQWAVCIKVRWFIITVPMLFVLGSIIFLASCIRRTAGASGLRVWKENPLPGLIMGLRDEERAKAKAVLDAAGWDEETLEMLCRELMVELRDPRRLELMA